MAKKYKTSLFIFRRGLRTFDNTALIAAAKNSDLVIPAFIFDPRQVEKNEYRSENLIQFMVESLEDLKEQIKKQDGVLNLFYSRPEQVIEGLAPKIDAVFVNRDYTPFSKLRDKSLQSTCKKLDLIFEVFDDYLLNTPESVFTGSGNPYTVFTPFWKTSRQITVRKPTRAAIPFSKTKYGKSDMIDYMENENIALHGGRSKGQKLLRKAAKFEDYASVRDIPAHNNTLLSAHLKFGTLSIREVFHTLREGLGHDHPLIRQLYWRDFYTHVAYHFPRVFGNAFRQKYDDVAWKKSKKDFQTWCEGKTGYPIVDAGMRELVTTGFMHNRVRMIVASFLTKDLHLDWRWGEKFFAQHLVDYDASVNNGNWQWAASTGCDPQPYFRIFNPLLQQKKFDPNCTYIKQWIPELKDVDPSRIHKYETESFEDYPAPIVNHRERSQEAKAMYKILT